MRGSNLRNNAAHTDYFYEGNVELKADGAGIFCMGSEIVVYN